ncbi:organic hydroperoxide resistance protein [Falsirhodobacter sp. alg1]|uniref:organic hydroperoxide resistance protein n=1 Tax=Falsirhodobacter sp. alg1 TaxID=1472418 RepID=UPI0005F0AD33|nr:organic hydroperoxide resistance protein [Falsirhodobacter sp. alg1]
MSVDPKYLTEARATGGGRNGIATLKTGMLTLTMTSPKELGGSGAGHNPEELFALGYAACFLSAMRFAAQNEKLGDVPESATVDAQVGIGPRSGGGFGLTVQLKVDMPGLDRAVVETIVERGHFVCPYSNATSGNIAVETVIA